MTTLFINIKQLVGTREQTVLLRGAALAQLPSIKNAFLLIEDRKNFLETIRPHLTDDCVLLLMGARDPSLEDFGKEIYEKL